MSVEDCIERFKAHADVFDQEPPIDSISFSLRHPHFGASSWSFSETEKLYRPASELTVTNTERHEDFYMDLSECKTLAVCEQIRKDRAIVEPYIFCSYALPMDRTHPTTVSDVARAITTRHSFKPNNKREYHDGSSHTYNPSYEVYKEFGHICNWSRCVAQDWNTRLLPFYHIKWGQPGFQGESTAKKLIQICENSASIITDYKFLAFCHGETNNSFLKWKRRQASVSNKHRCATHCNLMRSFLLKRGERGPKQDPRRHLRWEYRSYVEDCSQRGKNFPGREEFLNHLIKALHVKPPPASTRDEIRKALDDGRV